jgi:murein endopeptidase
MVKVQRLFVIPGAIKKKVELTHGTADKEYLEKVEK